MSIYTFYTQEKYKMFIQPITDWVKSLSESFSKPQTYGSALEHYIVSNEPKDAADVDRLTREFEMKKNDFYWVRGF
jgi:hypothetical protein